MGCPGICWKTEDSLCGIYDAFINTGREESEASRGTTMKHWKRKSHTAKLMEVGLAFHCAHRTVYPKTQLWVQTREVLF